MTRSKNRVTGEMVETEEVFILVRAQIPKDCGTQLFREYCREAVGNWAGQFDLRHPLCGWFSDDYARSKPRLRVKYFPFPRRR